VIILLGLIGYASLIYADVTSRPVIGVLSLPMDSDGAGSTDSSATSYIVSSYVKWLEGAGARVVPIRFDTSYDKVDALLPKLNGVLFTGGSAGIRIKGQLTPFGNMGCYIYNKIVNMNNNGQYFPLWGTCLGFEFIQICASNNQPGLLSSYVGGVGYTATTTFTAAAATSRLFSGNDGSYIMNMMEEQSVAYLYHAYGVSPSTFNSVSSLNQNFNLLATQVDPNNAVFVAAIENKKYPIYATQFHPEKNMYEWSITEPFPHTPESTEMSTYFVNFFMNEVRKNTNNAEAHDPSALDSLLIYNTDTVFTNGYYTQIYYLDPN